uniref:Uncharacterized protein n=1 Tax=Gallus gallus TaxID=9031 RepID=A0A8V0ZLA8_CHICK
MAVSADAVVVEEAEPQQVDDEPRHPHGDDHQRLLDLVGLGEALDGLQQDGEAEGGEEDGVDQGAHHLGAHPAERVLLGGAGALGEAHGHQRHDQGHDIGEHVEGVGQHGQRRRDAAHHHLYHEEEEGGERRMKSCSRISEMCQSLPEEKQLSTLHWQDYLCRMN